jgi:hypothetical protein
MKKVMKKNIQIDNYWSLLKQGSDSGADSMDNNILTILKTIKKLLVANENYDSHSGQIVTYELFAYIIEGHKDLIHPDNEEVYKLYISLLKSLDLCILEGYQYLDEWEEISDQEAARLNLIQIYNKWQSALIHDVSDNRTLDSINYHLNNRIREKALSLVIKTLGPTKELIKKQPFEELIDSITKQHRDKSVLIIYIILRLIIDKEIEIDKSQLKSAITKLDPHYTQIGLWKDYYKLLSNSDTISNSVIKDTITITGTFGINREDIVELINNSKTYKYTPKKNESNYILSGIKPSYIEEKLSKSQKILNLVDLLELLE